MAWSNVLWLQLFGYDGRVYVWCRPHEAMESSCQQGIIHVGGGSIIMRSVCSGVKDWVHWFDLMDHLFVIAILHNFMTKLHSFVDTM